MRSGSGKIFTRVTQKHTEDCLNEITNNPFLKPRCEKSEGATQRNSSSSKSRSRLSNELEYKQLEL
jgi:hypothetical protein